MSTNDQYKRHDIPEVWVWARLEEICAITDRDHRTPKYVDGGVPLISPKDFSEHGIDLSNLRTVDQSELDAFVKKCNPERGDVLYSRIGTIGKARKLDFDFEFVALHSLALLKPFQGVVSSEWLLYLMKSPGVFGQARENIKSVGTPDLGLKRMQKFDVPVAPKAEQARIVSKIDELFSRIDEGECALGRVQKLVERYRQSVLKAAVTGELTREWREKHKDKVESGEALLARILKARREAWEMTELAKMKAKGMMPANSKWKQKYEEPSPPACADLSALPPGWTWASFGQLVWLSQNGISKRAGDSGREVNVLRLADISDGLIDSNAPRSIRLTAEEVDRYVLEVGDLLCVRVNGSRRLTGRLVPIVSDEKWAYCDHFIRFRPVPGLVSSLFLDLCFDAGHSRSVVESSMVTTAGQNTVSQGSLFAVPIPLPPLAEQAVLLSEVERRLTQADRNLQDLSVVQRRALALRQAVLRSAFSGSLVAQNAGDEPASLLLERIAAERGATYAAPKRGRKKNSTT